MGIGNSAGVYACVCGGGDDAGMVLYCASVAAACCWGCPAGIILLGWVLGGGTEGVLEVGRWEGERKAGMRIRSPNKVT